MTQELISEPRKIGPYQLQEELGKGGMAIVYRAIDTRSQQIVAIKVLPPVQAYIPGNVGRFNREAQHMQRLRHKNIVQVYETGYADEMHYIALQYADNGTLQNLIRQTNAPLPLHETIRILSNVAEALDFAHKNGFLHRDIKPSNILLTKDQQVLLTDFGVARELDSEHTQVTTTGFSVGTPAFMSPEQAKGVEDLDARSDIYSLGVVAYIMLTGRRPHHADSDLIMINKIINDDPTPPQVANPTLNPNVASVLRNVLAKDRALRYASANEFVRALQKAQALSSSAASQPSAEEEVTGIWDPQKPEPVNEGKTTTFPSGNLSPNAPTIQETIPKAQRSVRWLYVVIPLLAIVLAVLVFVAQRYSESISEKVPPLTISPTVSTASKPEIAVTNGIPSPTIIETALAEATKTATPTAIATLPPTIAPSEIASTHQVTATAQITATGQLSVSSAESSTTPVLAGNEPITGQVAISDTPTLIVVPNSINSPSNTPTPSATALRSATETDTPRATDTPEPTATTTETPSATPIVTATPTGTATPTITATPIPLILVEKPLPALGMRISVPRQWQERTQGSAVYYESPENTAQFFVDRIYPSDVVTSSAVLLANYILNANTPIRAPRLLEEKTLSVASVSAVEQQYGFTLLGGTQAIAHMMLLKDGDRYFVLGAITSGEKEAEMSLLFDAIFEEVRLVDDPTATPTATATETATTTPSVTPTATATSTATATITPTHTVLPTEIPTETPTLLPTATITPTSTATLAPSATNTHTETTVSTFTNTATPVSLPSDTPTALSSATATTTPTPSSTQTATATETATITPDSAATQAFLATKTAVAQATLDELIKETVAAVLTATAFAQPTLTATPTPSPTLTQTPTNTATPSATATQTPDLVMTVIAIDTQIAELIPLLTPSLTPTPSDTATIVQLATATLAPVVLPTDTVVAPTNTPAATATSTSIPTPARPEVVTDFENFGRWQIGRQKFGTFKQTSQQIAEGKFAAELTYDFPASAGTENFVVFEVSPLLPIDGSPAALQLQVYGNQSNNYLNLWVKDSAGLSWQFTFGQIRHSGWATMIAALEPNQAWPVTKIDGPDATKLTPPLFLRAIVLDSVNNNAQDSGVIYLDDLKTADEAVATVAVQTVAAVSPETPKVNNTNVDTANLPVTETLTTPEASSSSSIVPQTDSQPGGISALSGRIAYPIFNGNSMDIFVYGIAEGAVIAHYTNFRQPDYGYNCPALIANGAGGGVNNIVRIFAGGNTVNVSSNLEDNHPQWSPGCTSIAYASTKQGDGKWRVYWQNDASGEFDAPPLMYGSYELRGKYPIYLLGWRIAFNGCNYWDSGSNCGIYTTDTGGSIPSRVTDQSSDIPSDALGNRILFHSQRSGNWDVWAVNADGSGLQQMTNSPANDGLATASPDNQHIAFLTNRDGNWAVYVMNSDGTNQQKLFDVNGGYGSGEFDWSQERLSWGQ